MSLGGVFMTDTDGNIGSSVTTATEKVTGLDSNLWMGVDYANDTEVVKIDKLQANSELYFFQMRMKMDVNIARPAEIVCWTAYANA